MGCRGEPLFKMGKIYGLFGAMSGKVADVVMSVRNGQQIVRKYQPVVANPKTQNQFSTRARFKLLSQLSALLAAVIAIPRKGGVSPRNQFTSINFPLTTFANSQAEISLSSVQITNGILPLPALDVTADAAANLTNVSLSSSVAAAFNRIVYCYFNKTTDNELLFIGSAVISEAGVNGTFPTTIAGRTNLSNLVVYAYGIRDNNSRATLFFGDIEVPTAESIAKLIVSSTLSETDITLSRTVAFVGPTALSIQGRETEDDTGKKAKK